MRPRRSFNGRQGALSRRRNWQKEDGEEYTTSLLTAGHKPPVVDDDQSEPSTTSVSNVKYDKEPLPHVDKDCQDTEDEGDDEAEEAEEEEEEEEEDNDGAQRTLPIPPIFTSDTFDTLSTVNRRRTRRFASPGLVPDPLMCYTPHYTTDLDSSLPAVVVRRCVGKEEGEEGEEDGGRSLSDMSCEGAEGKAKKKERGRRGRRRRRRRRSESDEEGEKEAMPPLRTVSGIMDEDEDVGLENEIDETALQPMPTDGEKDRPMSFTMFRIQYLIVHIAIMLADGLQGTHLYVLYEGYGYSVASLYCLGFVSGALTSPLIGPFVDFIGRKNAAMLYCVLEIAINMLEQYPIFAGLIVSRVVGGITTNLLFSVFESWLVTEHRRRGYKEEGLETILRDSVILSNLAAIASGWLAHVLAGRFGPVGPFEGAVSCTAVALVLVAFVWTENYGSAEGIKSVRGYMAGAFKTIVSDSKISRIGITQGLTEGALQTFVFLWSPALRHFSRSAPSNVLGLDENGEPAYGLIFGAFMACGVLGGLSEPMVRKAVTIVITPRKELVQDIVEIEGEGQVRPMAVEFLAAMCYTASAGLLMTPYLLPEDWAYSFSFSLVAFLLFEFLVGLYMPCEGVIRSIYMPNSSICSLMTMLRVIVNVAVALGVISTNYVPFKTAFAAVSTLMIISASLQLSMVSRSEWSSLFSHLENMISRKSKPSSPCFESTSALDEPSDVSYTSVSENDKEIYHDFNEDKLTSSQHVPNE